jgi:L-lactate dehydrogenase complex protein LldG
VNELHGETRESLLQRVRAALGRGATAAAPPAPKVSDATARLRAGNEDLASLFVLHAAAVGMQVQRISERDLASAVIEVLRRVHARRIGVSETALLAPLREAGFELIDWTTQSIQAQFDLDAGVTGVEAAIAETGSLVCVAGPGRSRGLSLIPAVHVAVVREADLIPDLLDLWPRLLDAHGKLPSSAAIITGPSKTADIEGILVTGVHGPEQVFILLVA